MFSPPLQTLVSFSLLTILFFIAALYAWLGLYAWRKRPAPAVTPFAWLMFAMAWWSFSYGLELFAGGLGDKLIWVGMQYVGAAAIPVWWMRFSLEYTGREGLEKGIAAYALWIVPALTILFAWTNDFHHLLWVDVNLVPSGGLGLLNFTRGWWYRLFIYYSYGLILSGSIMAASHALRLPRSYRGQAAAILAAVLFPFVGNILFVFRLLPTLFDPSPFLFLPSGFCFAWAITRYRLLETIAPTQNAILQNLRDGVILLDRERRVLYMNRMAETIFSRNGDQSLGLPVETVCAPCGAAISAMLNAGEQSRDMTLAAGGNEHQFEVRAFPMGAAAERAAGKAAAHIVILHDITESRSAGAALKRRDVILRVVNLVAGQFLKSSAWEQNVLQVLEQLGIATQASRVYIFERHYSEAGAALVSQRYEWTAEDIEPQIENPALQNQAWREAGFARWEDALEQGQIVSGLVRNFPPSERELLAPQDILSLVVVPISLDEKLWGFIGFDDCIREREWSEAELGALRAAADIFSAALARRTIELRLLKRQHSQQLLQEIIRAALGKDDIAEVSQYLVEHIAILINADLCFLSQWDEIAQRVIPMASYGFPTSEYRRQVILPGQKSLTVSALEDGQMLIVDNVLDSPRVDPLIARRYPVHSALAIPLTSNETKLGTIILGFSEFHRFTPEEIILSEDAANLAALALAKFRAVEEAQRRANEAETLQRAVATVAGTLDLRETTTRILEQLAFVLPHDSASVQLLRGDELEIVAGEGWPSPNSVIGIRFPVPSDNPNTEVILSRKPLLLHEVDKHYAAFRNPPHDHIRSWLGVPLNVRNQVIGLLAIDGRDPFQFHPEDIELVNAFAQQVAVAIENARLFDEVQQLAITDGLTGLFNRRHFMELAQVEFERARRYKRHLTAMMFDIDHFKKVNDVYGHPVGDRVLQAIAKLCKEKLREADPIARYGGEEFIALIVEARPKIAQIVAERLRAGVEQLSIDAGSDAVTVTVSVGLAGLDNNTPNLETLVARADQALYVAKRKGRNRVNVGR